MCNTVLLDSDYVIYTEIASDKSSRPSLTRITRNLNMLGSKGAARELQV